jgi:hypothetical protein
VNEARNNLDLPKQTTDKLVEQMVSMFDQLPLEAQNTLLTYRWDKIAGPSMLPILRRYARDYRDYPENAGSQRIQLAPAQCERPPTLVWTRSSWGAPRDYS